MKNRTQAMELVRWTNLLPSRLDRNILRIPDSHSRARASSSFPPLPSFQPADVSHPDHTILLQTAHLLASQSIMAQLHLWLSSPNRNAGLFTTWAHSHDPAVIAVSISRLLTAEKRSYCSMACWLQQILEWQETHVKLMFNCSTQQVKCFLGTL